MTTTTQAEGAVATPPVPRTPGLRRGPRGPRAGGYAYLLLLPALLPVVVFSVLPLLNGIYLGFTDARAGFDVQTNLNGFDNYVKLWQDRKSTRLNSSHIL